MEFDNVDWPCRNVVCEVPNNLVCWMRGWHLMQVCICEDVSEYTFVPFHVPFDAWVPTIVDRSNDPDKD